MFQIITNYFFHKKAERVLANLDALLSKENLEVLNRINPEMKNNFSIKIKSFEDYFELIFDKKEETIKNYEELKLNFAKNKTNSNAFCLSYMGYWEDAKKTFTKNYAKEINESLFLKDIKKNVDEQKFICLNKSSIADEESYSKYFFHSIDIPKKYDLWELKIETAFMNLHRIFKKKLVNPKY
jgi:hypothetical protein